MHSGIINLPLHYGKSPLWLFERMKKLSSSILCIMLEELGEVKTLEKFSDPMWFQSFGCILGFDWHSSGLTTTVLGALKEGFLAYEKEYGFFICGGKGKTSRKTPLEIETKAERYEINSNLSKFLIYISKLSAKVDNSLVQDGYNLYHHNLIFTKSGKWVVIQQGMNQNSKYARRYHWFSEKLKKFVISPHSGISAQKIESKVLDLTAKDSEIHQKAILNLIKNDFKKIFILPKRHKILQKDFNIKRIKNIFDNLKSVEIEKFEDILKIKGLGPKTIRALSLISEIIYGTKPSYKDPARFSYAHGGKDGYPYFIRKDLYDKTIEVLEKGIKKAKISRKERYFCLKRLYNDSKIKINFYL